jgi:alpha(1,3/1,4) fucosyltransferase
VLDIVCCDHWDDGAASRGRLVRRLVGDQPVRIGDPVGADLVIYGAYGFRHHRSRGVRLALSLEPHERDPGAHWTIDSRLGADDRHLHLPPWMHFIPFDGVDAPPVEHPRPHFCNFIVSNPGCRTRNRMFMALDRRRRVHSLGTFLKNSDDPRLSERDVGSWRRSKLPVLADYRFTLAFENCSRPGYATEKLIDAWLAGSVPIYWGDPHLQRDFPTAGMVVLERGASIEEFADRIIEIDDDPDRYRQLQNANPFRDGSGQAIIDRYVQDIERFGRRVIDDARGRAGRPTVSRSRQVGALAGDLARHGGRFVERRAHRLTQRIEGRAIAIIGLASRR